MNELNQEYPVMKHYFSTMVSCMMKHGGKNAGERNELYFKYFKECEDKYFSGLPKNFRKTMDLNMGVFERINVLMWLTK